MAEREITDAIERAKEELRREIAQNVTTMGVQIGAVEKILTAKLVAMRWQMAAALVGGQALAGLVAAAVTKTTPAEAGRAAAAVLRNLI